MQSEYEANNFVSFDGSKVLKDAECEEVNILDPEGWDEDYPDDEEHSGDTGNEGCTAPQSIGIGILPVLPTSFPPIVDRPHQAILIVPSNTLHRFMFRGDRKWPIARQWLEELGAGFWTSRSAPHKVRPTVHNTSSSCRRTRPVQIRLWSVTIRTEFQRWGRSSADMH